MSFQAILILIVAVLCAGLALWVYVTIVTKNLAATAIAVDKQSVVSASSGFFAKISAYTMHWKTVILAWIAVVTQAFSFITSDMVQGWSQLPWSNVVDAKVANWITIVCALLIPITHSIGIKNAAEKLPADPPAET